jgi:lipoprotein-anchoring transpeptidase ErfK/SrfK
MEKRSLDELAPQGGPTGGGPLERVRLRWRLWQLQRVRDSQLKELAGVSVELHRLDSSRGHELPAERLATAAATDGELIALERQLGSDRVGGTCSRCGLHTRMTRYCLRCGEKLPGHERPSALSLPGALFAVVAISAAWLLGGVNLGSDSTPRQASVRPARAVSTQGPQKPTVAPRPKFSTVVATVRGSRIAVYRSPRSKKAFTRLDNPNLDGARLVFLVRSTSRGWANVLLPIRPNGSSGWIPLSHVSLSGHSFRLSIDLDRHRLTAWNARKMVLRTAVGVGRAVTPTPAGLYYITELLKQPNPTGTYGPYAFGLSAHSNVLHEFAGRDGILGIHGTDFPNGIGTNVSHGCIRLSNRAIIKLARVLPVGTPVRITRRHA